MLRITDVAEVAGAFAPRRLVSLTEFPRSFDYTHKLYRLRGAARQFVRAGSLPEALENLELSATDRPGTSDERDWFP